MKTKFCNPTETFVVFANTVSVGEDGWAQIAPLGDYRGMAMIPDGKGGVKRVTAIQRVDKASVVQMVNEFSANRRGLGKYLKAPAIYSGHPDVPALSAKYPDKEPKGVFADLQCREDGFFGQPIFTNSGEQLLATQPRLGFSGRWEAEEIGEENGVKVFRPNKFISAGLTANPNLPVQLVNESEQEQTTNIHMKQKIIAFLANHKITLANDATDEQVEAALAQVGNKLGEAATLANDKTMLQSTVTTHETEIAALKTERDTAKTSFANERKARVQDALAIAISSGRITEAERADWERRLGDETQFANESAALAKLSPKIKTESVILNHGSRKIEIANSQERGETVTELVNDRIASAKCDYDHAFAWVQKSYPQLFSAMQQPEIKSRKK